MHRAPGNNKGLGFHRSKWRARPTLTLNNCFQVSEQVHADAGVGIGMLAGPSEGCLFRLLGEGGGPRGTIK